MIDQIKKALEFSEQWWGSAKEGDPIAHDEIELAKEMNAAAKSLLGEVERLQQQLSLYKKSNVNFEKHFHEQNLQILDLRKALEPLYHGRYTSDDIKTAKRILEITGQIQRRNENG